MRQLCQAYRAGEIDPDGVACEAGSGCELTQLAEWEARTLRCNPLLQERVSEFWGACCRHPHTGQRLRPLQLESVAPWTAAAPGDWAFHPIELDPDTTESFKEFLILPDGAEELGRSDHGRLLCLTAFAVLLRHESGCHDYVLSSTVSVRGLDLTTTRGLVGPLTNDVPLHVITSDASSFLDIFVDLGNTLIKCRDRAMYSARACPAVCGLEEAPIKFEFFSQEEVAQFSSPVYSAGFLGSEDLHPDDGGPSGALGAACRLSYRELPTGMFSTKSTLLLRMWESPDPESNQIFGGLWYRSDLLSLALVESLVQKFGMVVEEASNEPALLIGTLDAALS